MFTLWDRTPAFSQFKPCIVQVFSHRMTLIKGTSFTHQPMVSWCFMLDEICQKSGWDVLVP